MKREKNNRDKKEDSEVDISRRKALSTMGKIAVAGGIGVVAGAAAGYFGGLSTAPVGPGVTETSTKTVISTISGPGTTVTKTTVAPEEWVAPSLKGVPEMPFKEVVIADIFPLTGSLAKIGLADHLGVKAAVEYINEVGGFGGAKVTLVSGDARSDPTVAVSETERIISEYQPTAVVGYYSSALSLPGSDVTEKNRVPLITHSVADAITERGYKYVFRTVPKGTHQGEINIIGSLEFFKAKGWTPESAMVVYEDTPSPRSLAEGYFTILEQNEIPVILDERYPPAIKDVTDIATKIMAADGDVLCINAYMSEAILFWTALRNLGYKGKPIITAGYITPEFGDVLGWDKVIGTLMTGTWTHSAYVDSACFLINELYLRKARAEGYEWRFTHEAAGNYFGVMYMLGDAITRARSTDPEDVRNALSETYLNARDKTNPFWLGGAASGNGLVKFDEAGQNIIGEDSTAEWVDYDPWLVTVWPPYMETPGGKVLWPIP